MKNRILSVLMLAALSGVAMPSFADDAGKVSGYVLDQRGQPVRSGQGLCWRTGYWTPALATAECDPDLVAKATDEPTVERGHERHVKPVIRNEVISADTLFDFNKAVLHPAGKEALDRFVADASNVVIDLVAVVGHADRIGSASYNQKLSEKRAKVVMDYLISKGIPEQRIVAEGHGKREPVTGDSCKGTRKTKALIECLAPDRRVEVELVGTGFDK